MAALLPQHISAPPACTQLRHRCLPVLPSVGSPPAPHLQRPSGLHLLPTPQQPPGGSPCASRELMLQMMLLTCQLLNPAPAPAEVCLNSSNCTNMVFFLPQAKPYSSRMASGCSLKLLLAQSRAGLVQHHAARAGLVLLAPITPLSSLLSPLAVRSLLLLRPRCRQQLLALGVWRWRGWVLRGVGSPCIEAAWGDAPGKLRCRQAGMEGRESWGRARHRLGSPPPEGWDGCE